MSWRKTCLINISSLVLINRPVRLIKYFCYPSLFASITLSFLFYVWNYVSNCASAVSFFKDGFIPMLVYILILLRSVGGKGLFSYAFMFAFWAEISITGFFFFYF